MDGSFGITLVLLHLLLLLLLFSVSLVLERFYGSGIVNETRKDFIDIIKQQKF